MDDNEKKELRALRQRMGKGLTPRQKMLCSVAGCLRFIGLTAAADEVHYKAFPNSRPVSTEEYQKRQAELSEVQTRGTHFGQTPAEKLRKQLLEARGGYMVAGGVRPEDLERFKAMKGFVPAGQAAVEIPVQPFPMEEMKAMVEDTARRHLEKNIKLATLLGYWNVHPGPCHHPGQKADLVEPYARLYAEVMCGDDAAATPVPDFFEMFGEEQVDRLIRKLETPDNFTMPG